MASKAERKSEVKGMDRVEKMERGPEMRGLSGGKKQVSERKRGVRRTGRRLRSEKTTWELKSSEAEHVQG